jgi:hypothetical protein
MNYFQEAYSELLQAVHNTDSQRALPDCCREHKEWNWAVIFGVTLPIADTYGQELKDAGEINLN